MTKEQFLNSDPDKKFKDYLDSGFFKEDNIICNNRAMIWWLLSEVKDLQEEVNSLRSKMWFYK